MYREWSKAETFDGESLHGEGFILHAGAGGWSCHLLQRSYDNGFADGLEASKKAALAKLKDYGIEP